MSAPVCHCWQYPKSRASLPKGPDIPQIVAAKAMAGPKAVEQLCCPIKPPWDRTYLSADRLFKSEFKFQRETAIDFPPNEKKNPTFSTWKTREKTDYFGPFFATFCQKWLFSQNGHFCQKMTKKGAEVAWFWPFFHFLTMIIYTSKWRQNEPKMTKNRF